MRHIFTIYHPVVLLVYLASAIACGMATLQPAYVCISVLVGGVYARYLIGRKRFWTSFAAFLLLFAVVAIANPLFNHKGLTVLFELFGNPITLEATVYGLCAGGLLLSVLLWFLCYQTLMTNEKFLYLFGRMLPTLSLMLSMILKLIPQCAYKVQNIRHAQAGLLGGEGGGRREQLRQAVRTASILTSWTMEDSIETADSMRARGYGTANRTAYSPFHFAVHDGLALAALGALAAVHLVFLFRRGGYAFYPRLGPLDAVPLGAYAAYAALLAFPLILEAKERWSWRR